jgi:hypothetical protein
MYLIFNFEFGKETLSQTRTSEFKNGRISDKDNPCLGYPSLLHTLSKQLSMSNKIHDDKQIDCQSAVLFECSETCKR